MTGAELTKLRLALGWTQEFMGEQLGLSRNTVNRMETKNRKWRRAVRRGTAKLLLQLPEVKALLALHPELRPRRDPASR